MGRLVDRAAAVSWATDHDQAELRRAFGRAGLQRQERYAYVAAALGRRVDELGELSHEEAAALAGDLALRATIRRTRWELVRFEGKSLATWAEEAEAAAGIARSLAGTSFVPDSLKLYRDPARTQLDFDGTVAQVAAALMTGQELGFGPMASMRSIDVIPPGTGAPALRAAALRALVQQHGHDIWVVESTATRAIVAGRRAGSDVLQESTWTLDRAAQLGVRGFNDPRSSYRRQPGVMLVARATAEVSRWIASDVLAGLPYIVEEMFDDLDGAADESGPDGGAAGAAPIPRPSRRRVGPPGFPPGRAAPLAALPPADEPDAAGDEVHAGPGETPRMSPAQRGRFWAGMRRSGSPPRGRTRRWRRCRGGWAGRSSTPTT